MNFFASEYYGGCPWPRLTGARELARARPYGSGRALQAVVWAQCSVLPFSTSPRPSLQRRGLPWEPLTSYQEPTRFPEEPRIGGGGREGNQPSLPSSLTAAAGTCTLLQGAGYGLDPEAYNPHILVEYLAARGAFGGMIVIRVRLTPATGPRRCFAASWIGRHAITACARRQQERLAASGLFAVDWIQEDHQAFTPFLPRRKIARETILPGSRAPPASF